MKKFLISLAAGALALAGTTAPAQAQPRHGNAYRHADRGRHSGWNNHGRWNNHHRGRRVCRTEWRHHHRVRNCAWR